MPREIRFRAWDKRFKRMIYDSPMAILYLNDSDHELMQYTGLHDKNGKEIYHHDIVWDDFSGVKWLVEWDDENASFVLYEYPAEPNAEPLWIGCATKMEVINSKYEVE